MAVKQVSEPFETCADGHLPSLILGYDLEGAHIYFAGLDRNCLQNCILDYAIII